jgi:hypothetical protein
MSQFAEIIDGFEEMNFESQRILIDILNKRFEQNKHEIFAEETLKSAQEYKEGKHTAGSSEALFDELGI